MFTHVAYRLVLLRADGFRVILGDELSHDEAGFLYWQVAGEHRGEDVQIERIEKGEPRVTLERETIEKRGLTDASLAVLLKLHNGLW